MMEGKKWTLSTGKIVENELHKFGKRCKFEHPCLSFVIDPDDATLVKSGVFTNAEIQEIKDYAPVEFPDVPDDVVEYLSLFNCDIVSGLREICLEKRPWYTPFNRQTHFHHDWIRRTIDTLIEEFEAGTLKHQHHENWYLARIWSLMDRVYNDVEGLETVRGESSSIATASRKNEGRVIPSLVKMTRKAIGRRGDLILRKGSAEYGCAEAGGRDEGEFGTKKMLEKGIKAPKVLKDMLGHLCSLINHDEPCTRKLRTIGYIHSGLSMQIIVLDSPKGYCCRISRSRNFCIPEDAHQVRTQLLPFQSIMISSKLLVVDVIRTVETYSRSDRELRQALKNEFRSTTSVPTSPPRKTIMLPLCNVTPTKRKADEILK